MMLVAIDPSVHPVIAVRKDDGKILFWTEKRGATALPKTLRELGNPFRVYLEQPNYYFKGDSIQSALTFAESAGVLKGMIIALGWGDRTILVPPVKWMGFIDPAYQHPTGRAAYNARKKFFDDKAESLFPGVLPRKVKRSEGDALCILHYAIEKERKKS